MTDETKAMDKKGDPKDEYLDVTANMRHLWTLRFAQITVFVSINMGFFIASYGSNVVLLKDGRNVVSFLMIFLALSFMLIDYRIRMYYAHSRERAYELEHDLGFSQYLRLPPRGVMTTANAFVVIYFIFFLFWVSSLLFGANYRVYAF